MRYSVWNPASRTFDYYMTSEVQPVHTPAARHVPVAGLGANVAVAGVGLHRLGVTPEEVAWPLPPAARKVGSGPQAQGRIAILGGLETTKGTVTIAAVLVAAYLIGKKVLR